MFASTWHVDASGTDNAAGAGRAPDAAELFLVWAFAADRGTYPADAEKMAPEQFQQHVATRITTWAPSLRHLVASTDPATIAPVSLRTMPALTPWAPSNVTLLGDAIHNMTPMAGIGANTALRDADQLRQALLAPEPSGLTDRIAAYEAHMRTYANQALALSTRNARNAASPSRLPRLAFRSALRIAEAIPAAKRRMFATPAQAAR
jgi:2-polyprenyl-6-methoxyphenol hydroxylase-like FAD-dependent oxidoreductase